MGERGGGAPGQVESPKASPGPKKQTGAFISWRLVVFFIFIGAPVNCKRRKEREREREGERGPESALTHSGLRPEIVAGCLLCIVLGEQRHAEKIQRAASLRSAPPRIPQAAGSAVRGRGPSRAGLLCFHWDNNGRYK